jgi:hypothetical protein
MSDKPFQVPLSQGELALDRLAYSNWLSGIDPPSHDPIPYNPELEKRTARTRQQWLQRARDREQLATSELQLRILKQRLAREGSPLLRIAMMDEAERVRRLARGMFHHGSPCVRCGLTLRYNSTNKCVACCRTRTATWNKAHYSYQINMPLRRQRENRIAALVAGSARYEGRPCRKCGTTTYYTRNSHCVRCDTERQRLKKKNKRAAA